MKNKWWGYMHINGSMRAKRYFSPRDIQDARESDFVARYYGPFEAEDRTEALKILWAEIGTNYAED